MMKRIMASSSSSKKSSNRCYKCASFQFLSCSEWIKMVVLLQVILLLANCNFPRAAGRLIASSSITSSQSNALLSAVPSALPVMPPIVAQSPKDNVKNGGEEEEDTKTPPTVPIRNVLGLLGRHAMLPCDTTPPSPDNPLLLVIWFKEPSPDPVYSFDVRGNGVEIGRHWNDGINLGARARFDENSKPEPVLWIESLRDSDQGTYRCRVDFKQAPTKNFKINLNVIVPPGRPLIHNERGILVETTLGPYNEGSKLRLTCSVSGGRPPPSLHWLINNRPAPIKLVKDNLDPTDGLMSFAESRRTPSSKQSDYITSNSSLSSILPFKAQQQSTASDDLSTVHILNPLPLKSHLLYSEEITSNETGEKVIITQNNIHEGQIEDKSEVLGDHAVVGLERAKKSLLMSPIDDNAVETKAEFHTNGFINRRGIRKGLITSSLFIGAVQRKDVDTIYTCLASNSNMTQASRAIVKLQMNLLPLYVHITSEQSPLSAERVYDLHCVTFGSRPPALVTWWIGNTQLLDHSSQRSDGGNVTSSTLRFRPKIEMMGKMLRCRAENPVMPASQMEDTWSLDINYLPRVSLELGKTLKANNIKEGDDVYFECSVKAKPKAYKIEWKFNGINLRQDLRGNQGSRIIMGNQTLVLQSLGRNASGSYYCVATNSEGFTLSNAVQLDVKYKPVCTEQQPMVIGVALREIASVNCSVKANPTDGLRFLWTFNSSSELNYLPDSRFTQDGTTSQLVYSLNTVRDYGTILCSAENELGQQSQPCVFHLISAGPPTKPTDCNMTTKSPMDKEITDIVGRDFIQSTEILVGNDHYDGEQLRQQEQQLSHQPDSSEGISVEVSCSPSFDGGLPQTFVLEIRDAISLKLVTKEEKSKPYFRITHLPPETKLSLHLYAYNAKGNSTAVGLETITGKNYVDVKHSFIADRGTHDEKGGGDLKPLSSIPEDIPKQEHVHNGNNKISNNGRRPSGNQATALTILAGVGTALFLVTVVIGLVMIRFQSCRNGGVRMSRHSSGSSSHSRSHHTHQLGHHSRSGGSLHDNTWRTDSMNLEENRSNSSAHELHVSSTTASDRDLLQASPGPDQDELHPTHRRFISPRPSASGTKLYIHDNSLKCRANQQQQQRILSSFSSTAAMASSISNDNNRDGNDINSNNCSTNDGTHQINQTPSILAASTLPRNFSNKVGRDRGDVSGKSFHGPNPPQRTSYTKAVQQQEMLQHHQQSMSQNPQQRFQAPPPHHYSMTMGSRRGSRSNLSSSRNTFKQPTHVMQRTNQQSLEEEFNDSSSNIPPLPLRCLGPTSSSSTRRTSAGGTTAIAQQVSTNISDLNTNFSTEIDIQDRKMSVQPLSEHLDNNRLTSVTSLPSPPGTQLFSNSTMEMEQSFTQLLPPPATLASPSLEGSCDIVLPPPEESLYTLPRRKTNSISNGTHDVNALNQSGDNVMKSTDEPSNRSVRFEAEVYPSNASLTQTNTSSSSTVVPTTNSKSGNASKGKQSSV